MMKYVICRKELVTGCDDVYRLSYYTGRREKDSKFVTVVYGDILEAKRFDSLQEVSELIANPNYNLYFYDGFSIIGVMDETFEAIKENKELYEKYHTLDYAIS